MTEVMYEFLLYKYITDEIYGLKDPTIEGRYSHQRVWAVFICKLVRLIPSGEA